MSYDKAAILGQARYISLATFRRDGREVRTPVWLAAVDEVFYCFSAEAAGKVRRIRKNGKVRIAVCNVRGRVAGKWYDAGASLVSDKAECRRALRALRQRYGWQMWLLDILAFLGRRLNKRAVIALRLQEPDDEAGQAPV